MSSKSFIVNINHKIRSFKKVINVDSDKSISQRCFIIGSICEGISIVDNILESEDILSTIKCLKKLNCKIERLQKGKYKIVVDFGTATTFDVIKKNNYLGGVIAPGVTLSLDNLIKKASLIPKIELHKSKSIIGKNTEQAVLSGFFWGYNGLINGIISKTVSYTHLTLPTNREV